MIKYLKRLLRTKFIIRPQKNLIIDLRRLRKYKLKTIGDNVRIIEGFTVGGSENLSIGDNVFIGGDAFIDAQGEITINSGTMIGTRFTCISANHNYDGNSLESIPFDNKLLVKPIIINENVWIGNCVCIIPGIEIGEGAVIAMGTVVNKNVPPLAIVAGNPMRIIKYRDKQTYFKLKAEDKIYNKLYSNKEFDIIEQVE